jgi:hypothetical protein
MYLFGQGRETRSVIAAAGSAWWLITCSTLLSDPKRVTEKRKVSHVSGVFIAAGVELVNESI